MDEVEEPLVILFIAQSRGIAVRQIRMEKDSPLCGANARSADIFVREFRR